MVRTKSWRWWRKKPQARERKPASRWRCHPTVELLEQRLTPSTVVEVEPNDALALATALSLTQSPAGFHTSLGTGALSTTSDVDYWRFDALKGDRVSVAGD